MWGSPFRVHGLEGHSPPVVGGWWLEAGGWQAECSTSNLKRSAPQTSNGQRPALNDEPLRPWTWMTKKNQEKCRNVTIVNELGLHARSAAQIADIAQNSIANVWIQKEDEKADASSIIDILTLACTKGTQITIIIEDLADLPVLNTIADLVNSGFGE